MTSPSVKLTKTGETVDEKSVATRLVMVKFWPTASSLNSSKVYVVLPRIDATTVPDERYGHDVSDSPLKLNS